MDACLVLFMRMLTNNGTCLKKILLLTYCFLLMSHIVEAQDIDENGTFNTWYSEPEGINWLLDSFRPIYDFRPGETIASVGAGQGVREVVFSLMADSLLVYVQDVNPYWLEPDQLSKTIRRIYDRSGRTTCTSRFIPIRGKEKETRLPNGFFDKIIVENSLHEFTYQPEMLHSIRVNLKPNGILFIWEETATKPNRKHEGCKMPMFMDESLIKLVEESGFRFIEKTIVNPPKGRDAVFTFRLN